MENTVLLEECVKIYKRMQGYGWSADIYPDDMIIASKKWRDYATLWIAQRFLQVEMSIFAHVEPILAGGPAYRGIVKYFTPDWYIETVRYGQNSNCYSVGTLDEAFIGAINKGLDIAEERIMKMTDEEFDEKFGARMDGGGNRLPRVQEIK